MNLTGNRLRGLSLLTACALAAIGGRQSQAGSIQAKLQAGEYQLVSDTDGRKHIEMAGFGHLSEPGSPHLPSKVFQVAIPPGVKVQSVQFTPAQAIAIEGTHRIAPAPMIAPMTATSQQLEQLKVEYAQKVAAADASDAVYPSQVAEQVGTGAYRKYNLVHIRFTPFAYRALSGTLSLCPAVAVTIEYAESPTMLAEANLINGDNCVEAESLAREMIVNYDSIQSSYPAPPAIKQAADGEIITSTTTGFVIVTTDALEPAVAPLANWERCKGRGVHVETVEDIDASYTGDDRAERIRNFLRDNLASWNILYVMLIGDNDTVPMCPAYKEGPCGWGDPNICWEVPIEYVPTDYYYAELSLPDSQSWDSHDQEAVPTRGEQAYDLVQFPNEVNVGRLPLNDATDVETICRKMAQYEYSTDMDYKLRYLFASSYYWPDTDAAVTSEYMINHDIVPTSHSPVRIYEHDSCYNSSYTSQYDMSSTIVSEVWGNQHGDGYFGFVNLMGHGNPFCLGFRGEHTDQVQCPARNMFCTSQRTALNDDYPAMVYGNGCSTAEIEEANNLPRMLLRQGAVGFVGPTRNALGNPGWTSPASGSSQSLNYWFCHYAVTQRDARSTFGAAFQAALRHMYNDHGWSNDWGQFFEWNFFGNPDMSINTRPTTLPELESFTPTGWTFPLVPRNTGDATGASCVVSSTLPGNTDDTYFNFAYRNSGGVATPTNQTKIYVDSREAITKTIALGAGNSSLRINETSTLVIPGGRHTLAMKLDTSEVVWEPSETNNCWARQYVWSPPLLVDDQPLNMSAPPQEDAWHCATGTTYPNCDGFSFEVWPTYPTAGNGWSLVSVSRPASASSNLRLWGPGSYTGSTGGFGSGAVFGPVAGTGPGQWIVVNGANATRGTYYIGVSAASEGSVDYRIEKTSSVPLTLGTHGPYILDATGGAAQLFEIELQPGTWRFVLDQRVSTCDLGMTVYNKTASIAGKTGTGVLGSVNEHGVATDETLDVTIATAGTYAVAIWKVGTSDFTKSANYQIKVGVGGDAGVPSTPSPADGATGRSVATDLDWSDCANATYYRVYMRVAGAASFDLVGSPTVSTIDPGVLEYGTTYEWYVLAYNVWDEFTLGPTWTFTTMTEPDLQVIAPNGGETWDVGEVKNIRWTSNNCRGLVTIMLSRSGGADGTWETLATSLGVGGTYAWTVTRPVSSQCRIKILGGVCTDMSDADFAIAEPSITVTAPTTGATWYIGQTNTIAWTGVGDIANVRIELTRDAGSTWTDIVASTPNDGGYKWTATSPSSLTCQIRISDADDASVVGASGGFSIRARTITVTSPNGGEDWPVRSSQNITWTSAGLSGTLLIELSRDGGTTWHTLADSVPLASPWTWSFVTPPPSANCRIRVKSAIYSTVSDTSNADFTISCDVAPDVDGDCDVDWDDWSVFEACVTGPSVSYQIHGQPQDCTLTPDGSGFLRVDFDADTDVDQADFAVFQRCYSGADPANPACVN
jgi:hypothetical protein